MGKRSDSLDNEAPCINFEGGFNNLKCLVVLFKFAALLGVYYLSRWERLLSACHPILLLLLLLLMLWMTIREDEAPVTDKLVVTVQHCFPLFGCLDRKGRQIDDCERTLTGINVCPHWSATFPQ